MLAGRYTVAVGVSINNIPLNWECWNSSQMLFSRYTETEQGEFVELNSVFSPLEINCLYLVKKRRASNKIR